MRDRPDQTAALIKGPVPQAVAAVADAVAGDAALLAATGGASVRRGLYALDFMMDCAPADPLH